MVLFLSRIYYLKPLCVNYHLKGKKKPSEDCWCLSVLSNIWVFPPKWKDSARCRPLVYSWAFADVWSIEPPAFRAGGDVAPQSEVCASRHMVLLMHTSVCNSFLALLPRPLLSETCPFKATTFPLPLNNTIVAHKNNFCHPESRS